MYDSHKKDEGKSEMASIMLGDPVFGARESHGGPPALPHPATPHICCLALGCPSWLELYQGALELTSGVEEEPLISKGLTLLHLPHMY